MLFYAGNVKKIEYFCTYKEAMKELKNHSFYYWSCHNTHEWEACLVNDLNRLLNRKEYDASTHHVGYTW